jgi:hypothetical protein
VVLLKVDLKSVSVFEFKRDAPRAVDVNWVARRLGTSQRMKLRSGEVHVLWLDRHFEAIQQPQNPVLASFALKTTRAI